MSSFLNNLLLLQEVMETISEDQMNTVARFLESRDMVQEALDVATDPDYKFELALQLGDLTVAHGIAKSVDSEVKWKQLAELAMSAGEHSEPFLCSSSFLATDFVVLPQGLSAALEYLLLNKKTS